MTLVHQAPVARDVLKNIAGLQRVVIEAVEPELDGGRFSIKRVTGESVIVEADIFADGHDHVAAVLLYRWAGEAEWISVPMTPLGNDRWQAEFPCSSLGEYRYTIEAWPDTIETWRADLLKRIEAGQDISVDLLIGAQLIEAAASRANGADSDRLFRWASILRDPPGDEYRDEYRKAAAVREDLLEIARHYPDRRFVTRYEKELTVLVDREKARFSTWYELFPRSTAPEPGRHGTFRDCESWLPYVASMGFDVLYLPPIHPIGRSFRKGRNNAVNAEPDDVGSPWAIGSVEGGHTSIHPQLGTLDDFRRLVRKAHDSGIEIALDIAFQASPDHPYVRNHPEWFRMRPDGTIQYAENPPKKYQDIYPFDFSSDEWTELWHELKSVFDFWIDAGVHIFRVDNPHTKPFAFWEWLIREIKSEHPDVLFLAEAFTRPKIMRRLAKLGFSQSYTYFAWRNTKQELIDYFTELARSVDFYRANLWPNTPDILTSFLQSGIRGAFEIRFILAATLGASYGIYGPAFELLEHQPRQAGSEEYLHSEKYELKNWDLQSPDSLRPLIAQVNQIRRENSALHTDRYLIFHHADNPNIICYSKTNPDLSNRILVVANLDPINKQVGFIDLDMAALNIDWSRPYQVVDLLSGESYIWHGSRNYIELTPGLKPAHILKVSSGA